jgi:hypothetical protein
MGCYNSELPIGPPGPTGPQGSQGEPGTTLGYKVYTALLTQVDDAAPTAIVLENTLGFVPVYSRDIAGRYFITYAGGFIIGKTFSLINGVVIESDATSFSTLGYETVPSANRLLIESFNGFGNLNDNVMVNTPIEIRIYP